MEAQDKLSRCSEKHAFQINGTQQGLVFQFVFILFLRQ